MSFAPSDRLTQSKNTLSALHLDFLGIRNTASPALHMLSNSKGYTRCRPGCKIHCMIGMPSSGCIVQVGKNLETVTPEMCFVQMAQTLTLEQLVELGFELCGNYVLVPPDPSKSEPLTNWGKETLPDYRKISTPITTPERLRNFIMAQSNLSGIKKARRAIKYVLPNSASPRETALAMLLSLPNSLGGCGLRSATLNQGVQLSPAAAKIVGHPTCYPDISFPGTKVAVEYDSGQWHAGEAKRLDDARRRNALRHDGYDVFEITSDQFNDLNVLATVMTTISKRVDKRLKPQCKGFESKQQGLHEKLRYVSHELKLF